MISVIVCSRNANLLENLERNIQKTIGCSFEVVAINNKEGKYSLSAAYNIGVKKAKYPNLCFIHEDVEFLTPMWGKIVVEMLKDKEIGLVGVAGSSFINEKGIWIAAGKPFIKGRIVVPALLGSLINIYSEKEGREDAVVVDGVFMAARKPVVEEFWFDEKEFNGFHFYDIDFSLRVALKYKVVVTSEILVKHYSTGTFGKEWEFFRQKFTEKHAKILPFPNEKAKTGNYNKIDFKAYLYDEQKREILKKNFKPRILVGCPTADSHDYCLKEYADAVKSLSYPNYDILLVDNSEGNEYFEKIKSFGLNVIKDNVKGSVMDKIVHSRNILRQKVLDEGYDYFLSLEQDVIPPEDIIKQLLSNKSWVSGGLYFSYIRENGVTKTVPLLWRWSKNNPEKMERVGDSIVFGNSLLKVDLCGLGCLLIHRSVLAKVKFRHQEGEAGMDDAFFCSDLAREGVDIYANTSIKCTHLIKNRPWKWRDKFPKILVGCSVSSKLGSNFKNYAQALKSIVYPNYDLLIVNSSGISEFSKKIQEIGLPVVAYCNKEAEDKEGYGRNFLRLKAHDKDYEYFLDIEPNFIPPADLIERLLLHKSKFVVAGFKDKVPSCFLMHKSLLGKIKFGISTSPLSDYRRIVKELKKEGISPDIDNLTANGGENEQA